MIMMKTTIVLCCDNCERVFGDAESVYGFFDDSCNPETAEGEVYICESCFNEIIESVVKDILNTVITNHKFYIGLNVSSRLASFSCNIGNHTLKFGDLWLMKKSSFFPSTKISCFAYKTTKGELIPFYMDSLNEPRYAQRIHDLLIEEFKEIIHYGSLNTVKSFVSSDRKLRKLEFETTTSSASTHSNGGTGGSGNPVIHVYN